MTRISVKRYGYSLSESVKRLIKDQIYKQWTCRNSAISNCARQATYSYTTNLMKKSENCEVNWLKFFAVIKNPIVNVEHQVNSEHLVFLVIFSESDFFLQFILSLHGEPIVASDFDQLYLKNCFEFFKSKKRMS